MPLKIIEEKYLADVAEFAKKNIAPFDLQIDRAAKLPNGLFQKVVDFDLLKVRIPKEYGGLGFSAMTSGKIVNIIAKANASVGVMLEGHYKSCDQIAKYGTEAAKKKYFPWGMQAILGFSNTEPESGSNPSKHQSYAVKKGDKWIISGDKVMITNGTLAQVYSVNVKTGPNEYSVFIVDKGMPGFSFGYVERFIGLRGIPCGEVVMDHIEVGEENLLGQIGQGLEIANNAHDDARYLMGAVLTGIQEHALDIAKNYVAKRYSGDSLLKDMQVTHYKLTKMATNKELTRLVYQEAARRKDAGEPYMEDSAMAKCFGSQAAVETGDLLLQIMGGYGYSAEFAPEHLIRDARAMEIAEGTLEKMYTEIANAEMANVPVPKQYRDAKELTSIDEILPALLAAKEAGAASNASVDAVSSASQAGPQLPSAKVVFALGRGANDPETIALAEAAAKKLNGMVGVTRPLVGQHFNRGQQLGVNGHKIAPDFLINLGIAGAPQYTYGITGAKEIVSVNINPNALILDLSDYKVVGSAKDFLKELLAKLN
ncbi:acyl-CoA dehydrogenase [Lactobacillus equicursoris]|uniref:Acyl-CoA dehydrogenase n=1 Tax=Lactobacillus equicursoris TaxID=420645 RepID=A0A844FL98_9LACO|nr:acyl-CoA dehydrogenase [Lactobacillus equicursoris]